MASPGCAKIFSNLRLALSLYMYTYIINIYIYHIYIYYIYTYTIECRAWVTSILDYQPPQIWSFPINTGVKEGTGIYIYILREQHV